MKTDHQNSFLPSLIDLYRATDPAALSFEHSGGRAAIFTQEPKSKDEFLEWKNLLPPQETQNLCANQTGRQPSASLLSYPDAARCSNYFAPRLEHSDQILLANFDSPSTIDLAQFASVQADGMIAHFKNTDSPSLSSVQLGMRTADCLTWVSIFELSNVHLVTFAHLGWRSFAKGLHFKILDTISSLVDFETWKGTAQHYLSPSIFGQSYPCHWNDVGRALENLNAQRSKRVAPVTGEVGSLAAWLATAQQLAGTDPINDRCHPDLQLLCLLDIVATGISPNRILVHRVNTAESLVYPSYRTGLKKENSDTRRLLTLVHWK